MTSKESTGKDKRPSTRVVSEEAFKQVYDSPYSLPGKERWVTADDDVRQIERLLGMEPKTIGAPLWVSGDTRHCGKMRARDELAGHRGLGPGAYAWQGNDRQGDFRGAQVRQR